MQKRTMRSLHIAALLSASAYAQSSTVTSTIPVCPTVASVTITLPTTVTFCPGPHCNGGGSGPQITAAPVNGVGMPGVNVGQYTSVGTDGKTTVLGIWETVYDSMCETGLVPATYTITAECPCEATPHPTVMPSGFQTTVVPCSVCAQSTVTLTQPCPTGPYASQTPSVGQNPALHMPVAPAATPAAPAANMPGASAGAWSGAGASAAAGGMPLGAMASAGSGSGAAAQVGSGGAMASAGSGAGASAQAGNGAASAGAGSGSGAAAQAGPAGAMASAGSGSGASAQAGNGAATGSSPKNNLAAAPIEANGTVVTTPANNVTRSGSPIQSFVSSAGQATYAGFTLFVSVIASLLL